MKTSRLLLPAASLLLLGSAHGAVLAHWKLDEASGSTAADSSGNGYDAPGGVGAWVTGVAGNAASDPTLQLASSDSDALNQIGGSITVSVWVKPDAATGNNQFRGIAGYEGTGGGGVEPYGFKYNQNDEIQWGVDEDYLGVSNFFTTYVDTDSGTPGVADEFVHLVGVFDHTAGVGEDDMFLYVNGALASSKNTSKTIRASGKNFSIGQYATGESQYDFDGDIDDVQVYDQPLSASEVSTLFNNPGTAIPEPSVAFLGSLALLGLLRRRR